MNTFANDSLKQGCHIHWERYYEILWHHVKNWVYAAHISSWQGQEEDVIAEVVHEAVARTFGRLQKAERGEASPILSLEHLSKVIARNYLIDIIRKERRILHFTQFSPSLVESFNEEDWMDLSEHIHDAVFCEALFYLLASEIISFPRKQKLALLIDLADNMEFDTIPTPLQQAFLKVGVQLKDYQQECPKDRTERRKHLSLLYHAYKRISRLVTVQRYTSTT
jgi:hypothetical protein